MAMMEYDDEIDRLNAHLFNLDKSAVQIKYRGILLTENPLPLECSLSTFTRDGLRAYESTKSMTWTFLIIESKVMARNSPSRTRVAL